LTTRTKKYAVKKAPNNIASEAMNRNIPSVAASSRELRFAMGGPWCSAWALRAFAPPSGLRTPEESRAAASGGLLF
jgi:hypothetical protein